MWQNMANGIIGTMNFRWMKCSYFLAYFGGLTMAVRRVLQIEQPQDAAVLRTKSTRITTFDKSLHPLIEDMIETMRVTDGVGIAAPQVGVLRRIVVIEQPAELEELEDGTVRELAPSELYVMINPEIVKSSDETHTMLEGCLSMPGRFGDVPRRSWVTIKYHDLHGKEQRIRRASAEGYKVGRMVQHEIDHLDGVMFTDRIVDKSTLVDHRDETPEKRRRRRGLLRRRAEPVAEASNVIEEAL